MPANRRFRIFVGFPDEAHGRVIVPVGALVGSLLASEHAAGMCALKRTYLNGLQDMRLITDAASAMNIVRDRGATMAGRPSARSQDQP